MDAAADYEGVFPAYLSLVLLNVALWLASLALGKAWPVDFIWSGYPHASRWHWRCSAVLARCCKSSPRGSGWCWRWFGAGARG